MANKLCRICSTPIPSWARGNYCSNKCGKYSRVLADPNKPEWYKLQVMVASKLKGNMKISFTKGSISSDVESSKYLVECKRIKKYFSQNQLLEWSQRTKDLALPLSKCPILIIDLYGAPGPVLFLLLDLVPVTMVQFVLDIEPLTEHWLGQGRVVDIIPYNREQEKAIAKALGAKAVSAVAKYGLRSLQMGASNAKKGERGTNDELHG